MYVLLSESLLYIYTCSEICIARRQTRYDWTIGQDRDDTVLNSTFSLLNIIVTD